MAGSCCNDRGKDSSRSVSYKEKMVKEGLRRTHA